MIIKQITVVMDDGTDREATFCVGEFYIYRGSVESEQGKRVKVCSIYSDVINARGLCVVYDPCDGSCTDVCLLRDLRPLTALEQLADCAE